MKEFYSLDVYKTVAGIIYILDLEPQQKISAGEEVLIDGEMCQVLKVEVAKMVTPNPIRRVGVLAKELQIAG